MELLRDLAEEAAAALAEAGGRVRAAGGIIYRRSTDGSPQLLLVHRPHYDDWTLPKGKWRLGERLEETALREVAEETGVRGLITASAGVTRYLDHRSRQKTVWYWLMEAVAHAPVRTSEIDGARWVGLEQAITLLSYRHDAILVVQAAPLLGVAGMALERGLDHVSSALRRKSEDRLNGAGALVVRHGDGEGPDVLLVRGHGNAWRLPRAKLAAGETPEAVALRAVAGLGVEGLITARLGVSRYKDSSKRARADIFWVVEATGTPPATVATDAPATEWVSLPVALSRLKARRHEVELLKRAVPFVAVEERLPQLRVLRSGLDVAS